MLAIGVARLKQIKLKADLLVGIEQVQPVDVGAWGVCKLGREVDGRATSLAFLGGDDDDAVGSAGTVDGGSRCVLEDGDVVDVGGVQACDAGLIDVVNIIEIVDGGNLVALHGDTVEHPKGFLHTVDGGGTTNAYLGRCARCTRCGDGGKTCDLSGQCLVDVLNGTHSLVGDFHLGDGGGELAPVNLLIAGDDDLAESLR